MNFYNKCRGKLISHWKFSTNTLFGTKFQECCWQWSHQQTHQIIRNENLIVWFFTSIFSISWFTIMSIFSTLLLHIKSIYILHSSTILSLFRSPQTLLLEITSTLTYQLIRLTWACHYIIVRFNKQTTWENLSMTWAKGLLKKKFGIIKFCLNQELLSR